MDKNNVDSLTPQQIQEKNEEVDRQNKKSYKMIYFVVGFIYAAEIMFYSLVVHKATLQGAQNVPPGDDTFEF